MNRWKEIRIVFSQVGCHCASFCHCSLFTRLKVPYSLTYSTAARQCYYLLYYLLLYSSGYLIHAPVIVYAYIYWNYSIYLHNNNHDLSQSRSWSMYMVHATLLDVDGFGPVALQAITFVKEAEWGPASTSAPASASASAGHETTRETTDWNWSSYA